MLSDGEKGSISIAFVGEIVRCLRRREQDPAPALAAARIAPALLADPTARVTPQAFSALWLAAAATLDDEFFGLDARRLKVGSFTALCRLAIRCATLDEALRAIVDVLNLVFDDSRLALRLDGADAWLSVEPAPRGRPLAVADRTFADETLFVLVHGLICWLIDRRIEILDARFAYPPPADRLREYAAIFCPEQTFHAPHSAVRFASLHLKAPIAQNERSASQFLRGAPATFLLKYRSERSLSARLRRLLREAEPAGWPSFEQAAAVLEVSESQLRRALERDGTSYLAIKDGLRRDRAIGELTEGRLPVADIAAGLGYAEASAFHRAFKKWTGVSPGDYRDGAQAGVAVVTGLRRAVLTTVRGAPRRRRSR